MKRIKIIISIDIPNDKNCSTVCDFIDNDFCCLFKKSLKLEKDNEEYYVPLRCNDCKNAEKQAIKEQGDDKR